MRSQRNLDQDLQKAQVLFLKGYIDQPLQIAQRGYQDSSRYPDLNWRFRILLADVRVKQGKPKDASELLSASPGTGLPIEITFRRRLVRAMAFCNLHSEQSAQAELSAAVRELRAKPQDGIQLQLATARCDQALGNFSKAYAEFAAIQQSSPQDEFVRLYALLGMGSCATNERQYQDALRWYLQAHVAANDLSAIPYQQVAQGNLGFLYLELGDVEQALTNSKAAVDLTTRGGTDTYLESWLLNLGRVYHNTGQSGLAKESYEKALSLASSRGNDLVAARCLHNLVQIEIGEGNIAQASKYHKEAGQLHLAKGGADFRDLRIDSAYLSAANADYSAAEPELLQLITEARETPLLEWSLEAELARVYEKQGRRSLADLWFRKSISTMVEASARMKQAPFAIGMLDSWPIFDDYIAFLYAQKQPEHALQVAQLARARNLAQQLGVKPHKEGPQAWVARIEAMLRSRHCVLLAYYEAEHETYAWIVTGEGVKMKALGVDQNDLETLADQYRAEIDQHYPIDSSPTQQKLYHLLVEPFQKLVPRGSHVILVGDSALYRINFETLICDVPVPHYWIDDAEIENASSIDLLMAGSRIERHGRGALIIGAPNQASPQYPLLPHAHDEVEAVKSKFKGAEIKTYEGAAATPEAYLSSHPSRFKYIEFATHSDASSSDPLKSTIVLAKDRTGSFQLSAREIIERKSRLNADLVSISGCYSSGKFKTSSEGLLGLQWAFMRAGAHQVVAGLWDVDDQSSPELMGGLYAGIMHGETAATALRRAKLKMIHAGKIPPAPYYWASLQLYTGL